MKWKEYKTKPQFPRPEMQTRILAKQDLIDDPDREGKTLVSHEHGVLSLWSSQMTLLAAIMERHGYKEDVTILWKQDPANSRYVIPTEVIENIA